MLLEGDSVEAMREMDEASVDAIVTDPPYGLEFMGKEWDRLDSRARIRERVDGRTNPTNGKSTTRTPEAYVAGSAMQAWHEAWAREAFRVLKPGGHMLAFGGTRTYHRLACAVEDAGFEIRDMVEWFYGSGFPKSLNVEKALTKMQGQARRAYGMVPLAGPESARLHSGEGTALKPAHEPIVLARKSLAESSIARQVLSTGTGAINVDGCRIGHDDDLSRYDKSETSSMGYHGVEKPTLTPAHVSGRFPANLMFSHHPDCVRVGERRVKAHWGQPTRGDLNGSMFNPGDKEHQKLIGYADESGMETVEAYECVDSCPVAELDRQSGTLKSGGGIRRVEGNGRTVYPSGWPSRGRTEGESTRYEASEGGASRFFYVAKASRAERNAGLEGMPEKRATDADKWAVNDRRSGTARSPTEWKDKGAANHHPTVKPIALMRYLCRLITPPGGTVLDPFAGSGSTGCAAVLEGFSFVGIEREPEYVEIARRRIAHWSLPDTEKPKVPEATSPEPQYTGMLF